MIEKAGKTSMYGGAAVSTVTGTVVLAEPTPLVAAAAAQDIYFGLTLNEWSVLGIIVGILTTLAGFLVSWYYQHQKFLREGEAWRQIGEQ